MATNDAIALLKADHKKVSDMLEMFETARSTKEKLAQQICQALTVHAQIEEEIFYPAAREALGDDGKELLDEAKVEHSSLKELISKIEGHHRTTTCSTPCQGVRRIRQTSRQGRGRRAFSKAPEERDGSEGDRGAAFGSQERAYVPDEGGGLAPGILLGSVTFLGRPERSGCTLRRSAPHESYSPTSFLSPCLLCRVAVFQI